MYYAAKNTHASDTSIEFANTWYVIGFATRADRDNHVAHATDLATKAILSTELRAYGARRGQISYYTADGKFMEHMQHGEFYHANRDCSNDKRAVMPEPTSEPVIAKTPVMCKFTSTKTGDKVVIDIANASTEQVLDAYNSFYDMSDTGGFPGSTKWREGRKLLAIAEKIGTMRPDALALRKKLASDKRDARLSNSYID